MKKYMAVPAVIVSLLLFTGCTNTMLQPQSTPQKQETKQNADQSSTEKQSSPSETMPSSTICEISGLGDTQAAWIKEFGEPVSQGNTLKNFKNGEFTTVFDKDNAITITFYGGKDGQKNPLIDKMLPLDGQKRSETSRKINDSSRMVVQKWNSSLLETAVPATKGNYTLMENYEGPTYKSTVVDCTPNLSK